ncbi:MAG: hypothetical protein M3072_11505 [Candidatus Dormibacteraeota bacterium]|nr:hypothetical protein [Candidatus Dormibacteraeota bacterium]
MDAGTVLADPVTDQRGIARPQGAATDVGAVEVCQSKPAAPALRKPANRASTTLRRVPLGWSTVACIQGYNVQIRRGSTTGTVVQSVSGLQAPSMVTTTLARAPETIGEWVDPQVTTRKKGLAFVAPVLPGKDDASRAFAREAFVARKAELTESRRALGQNLEVVTLTSTPMGSFVCAYLEGNDPVQGNRGFAASTRPYDVWFKDRLKELFPPELDFNQPLPPIEQVFDYLAQLVPA